MRQCGLHPTNNQWNTPIIVGGDLNSITHVAVAIDIEFINVINNSLVSVLEIRRKYGV